MFTMPATQSYTRWGSAVPTGETIVILSLSLYSITTIISIITFTFSKCCRQNSLKLNEHKSAKVRSTEVADGQQVGKGVLPKVF